MGDYGLLDLRYLARYYNEVLGTKYRVLVNSLEYPEKDPKITVVTVHAKRVPFAVSDVRAETLEVTLNFRVLAKRKVEILADMSKLLGMQRFQLVMQAEGEAEKSYRVMSFLEQQPPLGSPSCDTGEYMADYQITGTVLVSHADGGAVMSNDIVTEIDTEPIGGDISNQRVIATLQCQAVLGRAMEQYNETDRDRVSNIVRSQNSTYNILALNLGRDIDEKIICGIELTGGYLHHFYMRRTFPNGRTVEKNCILTGGSIVEQAGAYAQYEINLQEV